MCSEVLCLGFCTPWWACAWHTTDFSAFASCEALDQCTSFHLNSYRHAIRGIDGEVENEYSYTCLRHMVVIHNPPCVLPFRSPREPEHLEKHPDYPDPYYYLNPTSKYFFRAQALQHLRTVKGLQEFPTWP